jgi:cytochrome P450
MSFGTADGTIPTRTMMIAGHETTANTLSWTLLELCKYPEYQTRLRQEIRAQELKMRERGDTDFTWKDYESVPFLQSVIKVSSVSLRRFCREVDQWYPIPGVSPLSSCCIYPGSATTRGRYTTTI